MMLVPGLYPFTGRGWHSFSTEEVRQHQCRSNRQTARGNLGDRVGVSDRSEQDRSKAKPDEVVQTPVVR